MAARLAPLLRCMRATAALRTSQAVSYFKAMGQVVVIRGRASAAVNDLRSPARSQPRRNRPTPLEPAAWFATEPTCGPSPFLARRVIEVLRGGAGPIIPIRAKRRPSRRQDD